MRKLLGALLVGGAVAGLVVLYRDKLTPLATMVREKLQDAAWAIQTHGGEEVTVEGTEAVYPGDEYVVKERFVRGNDTIDRLAADPLVTDEEM